MQIPAALSLMSVYDWLWMIDLGECRVRRGRAGCAMRRCRWPSTLVDGARCKQSGRRRCSRVCPPPALPAAGPGQQRCTGQLPRMLGLPLASRLTYSVCMC